MAETDRLGAYSNWLVTNKDKQGTPEFETVANSYRSLRKQPGGINPDTDGPMEGFGAAFKSGIDTPLENIGETLEAVGATDAGANLRGLTDAPEGYASASERFINDPAGGDKGFGFRYLPKAVVEQAGQLGGSLVTRAGGAAIGAVAGSVIPGAGTVGGAAVGAFAGPALFESIQVLGPVANARARNDGRDKPNLEDFVIASGTAAGMGALNAIGVRGGSGFTSALREGGTEALQSVTEQTGSTVNTESGLSVDPRQAVGEGIIGGASMGTVGAARGAINRASPSPREDTPEARAEATFAQRIQRTAERGDLNGTPFNLKDVNTASQNGVRALIDATHTNIVGEIASEAKVLKDLLNPKDTDAFDVVFGKVQAQVGLKMARNKTKSVVTKDNFDALEGIVGGTVEGQNLINLVRESQVLTKIHNDGYKGGLSQYTDIANPLDGAQNTYNSAAQVARTTLGPLATATAAYSTGLTSIPIQAGIVGAGRGLDAITGRRSRLNRFVKQNANNPGIDTQSGLPSIRQGRIDDATEAARLEEANAAVQQARTDALKRTNLDLARKGAPPIPTSPQGTVEAATGLDRSGVARIMRVIQATNQDPLIQNAIEGYQGSVAVGGRTPDINPLIRAINQMVESQPAFKAMRVREPDTGNAQAAPIAPTQANSENYQRGIDDNKAMLQDLKDGAKTDPTMSKVDKAKVLGALDQLGMNLGSNPGTKVNEIMGKLQSVEPDAVAQYVEPYVMRVMGQQDAAPRNSAPGPEFTSEGALGSPTPVVHGQIKAKGTNHGLLPHLRVDAPSSRGGKALVLSGTNNKNASRQIDGIDEVLSRHPDPASSADAWASMMGDALATNDVPVQPNGFIDDINNGGAQKLLSKLTDGQIKDADHGFENAAEFRRAYVNGEISIEDTGRLFLWSFLSRGVSPYTQEGLFIDAFDGIDPWMKAAAGGDFNPENTRIVYPDLGTAKEFSQVLFDRALQAWETSSAKIKAKTPKPQKSDTAFKVEQRPDGPAVTYKQWASTAAPKGSGQPGAGAAHNLNAYGTLFLKKMSQDAGLGDGRSRLQVIHDMMSDPNTTGKGIRRQFMRMGEGVGIDNKVVSFTLLVAGFDDVMVLDRVQMRQMWNDGRFDGINLYDGYKSKNKPVTGSALSSLTYGARGLLIYEAMEQSLASRLPKIYQDLGRPEAASVGRYHWETWVASSEQEASHATIDAILARAKGDPNPLDGVTAKEGEYGAYAYGARYGIENNQSAFTYTVPGYGDFKFSVPQFQTFLEDIKKAKSNVVPAKFRVTDSGNAPWYTRDGVNLDALAEKAKEHGKQVRATDGELREDQNPSNGRPATTAGGQARQSIPGGILTQGGANPSNNLVRSRDPEVSEVKQETPLVNASIEIGLKGSEFENGIKDMAGVEKLAAAYGVVLKFYNSNPEMLQAVPSAAQGAMGAYTPRSKTVHVVSTGDIQELITALHETLHAVGMGSLKTGNFLGEADTVNGLTGQPDKAGIGSLETYMDFIFGKGKSNHLRREVLSELKHIQDRAQFSTGDVQGPIRGAQSMVMMLKKAKRDLEADGQSFEAQKAKVRKELKDFQNYERSIGELTVDALVLYAHDPKGMKRVAPQTAKVMRELFRTAGNKKIQFYSHPLAMAVAVVMAIMAKAGMEEEEEKQQMPPGMLSPQLGMLSA